MSPVPSRLVSIGLPVFNGEQHLAVSLDSLVGQSYENLEIIISDNHSTDATEAICRDYAARDPRIRYVRSERNRGAAWNFNRVLELSTGGYFKWASSNDLHEPDFVKRCAEVLESRPDVVICYPKTTLIDERGATLRPYEDNLDLASPDPKRRFREFLERVGLSNVVFGLIRPEALRRAGGLGNYPGADVVLLAELSLHGSFAEVPEYLFYRRQDRHNVVRDSSVENTQEFFDPSSRGKIFMRTWRHQRGYATAVLRSPVSPADKARLLAFIGHQCLIHRGILARELAQAASRVAGRRTVSRAATRD